MAKKYIVDSVIVKAIYEKFRDYETGNRSNGLVNHYRLDGASISVWRTGTLLIQGKREDYYDNIVHPMLGGSNRFNNSSKSNYKKVNQSFIIGTDEVGNGSYTGGMVAAAVYIPEDKVSLLKRIGIKDSKNILDSKIPSLAKIIRDNCPNYVLNLYPEKYNNAISARYNQVSLKVFMHNYCAHHLIRLYPNLKIEKHLVDGFTSQSNYEDHLKKESLSTGIVPTLETKAEDKYLAVAAASILAREAFLLQMKDLSNWLGLPLHQGVTDYVKRDVMSIKSRGYPLNKVVKLHFKNTDDWGL